MYMNDKSYELVAFWLIAAHLVISLIMLIVNRKVSKDPILKTKKSSKKQKDMLQSTTEKLEEYGSKKCSLLKNNKLVWRITLIVCITVVVLLVLCIWGDDEHMETDTPIDTTTPSE